MVLLLGSVLPSVVLAEAPWRIVSLADWHSSEGGVMVKNPAAFARNQASEKRLIAGSVACKPDVVIIAGDVGSGHWTLPMARKAGVLQQGDSLEPLINRLGDKTYRTMKANFAAAGVERLWVCVGDHGIGDNDWAPGSERSRSVPFHRKIFGLSYNADSHGKWLWPATVCGVPSRPLGTKYQYSSFAAQHKNVLFVQVDIFTQKGPGVRLHPRHGSINPDIEGEHLAWFEKVLVAGRKDQSVKYIFVQAHTPCLPPVRGQSSSMMMVAGYTESNLWAAMRDQNVDLFFAGEVHATTVSQDPHSDLVQVVTDRRLPTMITVHDDKLELQCYDREWEENGKVKLDPLFHEHKLTILKRGGKTELVGGKGVLKPLDTQAVFLHYSFDKLETTPFAFLSNQVVLENEGELNCRYDARAPNSRLVEGVLGKGLAFDKNGTVHVHGTGPFGFFDRTERTFSIWFKTKTTEKHNLVCGGSGKKGNKWGGGGFMDLVLEKGRLCVRTSAGETKVQGPKLNDGMWHHAVLVVAPEAKTLAHITVYTDGQARPWADKGTRDKPVVAKMGIHGLALAGPHRPVWRNQKLGPFTPFDGAIDDFAAWYRALSREEIKTLYEAALMGQNASQVDRAWRAKR